MPQIPESDGQIEWIKLRVASPPPPPYSPDLAPLDYWLFSDPKKMLQRKGFGFNEKVIAEAKTYFDNKDESFCINSIEVLEKHWNECIALKGNYVDE